LNVSRENNIARVNGCGPHHHEATSISSVLMAWDVMMCISHSSFASRGRCHYILLSKYQLLTLEIVTWFNPS